MANPRKRTIKNYLESTTNEFTSAVPASDANIGNYANGTEEQDMTLNGRQGKRRKLNDNLVSI